MAGMNFPGTGGGQQSPSGDPALPSPLVAPYMAAQAADAITGAQRTAMASGDMEQVMQDAVEQTLTTLVTQALEEMNKTKDGRKQLRGIRDDMRSQDAGNKASSGSSQPTTAPDTAPEAPTGAPASPTPPHRAEGRPAASTRPETNPSAVSQYKEGAKKIENAKMGDIARSVAGVAGRAVSESTPNWSPEEETGDLVHYAADGATVLSRVKQTEQPAEYARITRSVSRSQFVTGNLSRVAAGEGLAGSLGAVASKVAGPIGIAVGAASMGGHFLENQREEASGYRAAFGQEGTGGFAMKDRFQERLAGLTGFGGVGGDRAREQFQQASELGLRGERRDQARDFSSDMYLKFGMDTGDSMKIVSESIEQGNVSLKEFGDAITEVSRAAVQAGHNSSEAVKEFLEVQKQVSSNVVSGSASVKITKNIQEITDNLGRPVANALGGPKGVASMLAPSNVQTVAAMSGIDPLAAQYALQAGGDASTAMASKIIAGSADQVVIQVAAHFGMTPEQMKSDTMRVSGGRKELANDQEQELLLGWAGGDPRAAEMGIQVMRSAMGTFSAGSKDDSQIVHVFFQMLVGTFDQESKASEHSGDTSAHGKTITDPYTGKSTKVKYEKGGGSGQESTILSGMGYAQHRQSVRGRRNLSNSLRPDDEEAFDAYSKSVDKTGTGDKQIEKLLSKSMQKEIESFSGHKDASDAKYRVTGTDGKPKDVSLAEAISNPAYLPQVKSGKPLLVGADHQVRSISELTGLKGTGPSSAGAASRPIKHEIVLKGEAARLFKLHAPTQAQSDGVPASGRLSPTDISAYGSE